MVLTTGIQRFGSFRWEDDDTIIFAQPSGAMVRISADGGALQPIIKMKAAISQCPQILPDGNRCFMKAMLPRTRSWYSRSDRRSRKNCFRKRSSIYRDRAYRIRSGKYSLRGAI